jgi:predicted nucleotidyltransferase
LLPKSRNAEIVKRKFVFMEQSVAQHLPAIKDLLRLYGVEQAYLFGSAAKGTMNSGSDVDFIIRFPVDMPHTVYAENYFRLADALETLLQKKVDLVPERTLKNPYLLRSIDQNKLALL